MKKELPLTMLPSGGWFRGLWRTRPDLWRQVRDKAFRQHGRECAHCTRPAVDCHEVWRFTTSSGVQTLVDVIPVCKACHECWHMGLAGMRKRTQAVIAHWKTVTGENERKAQEALGKAWQKHALLDAFKWKLDMDGYMQDIVGWEGKQGRKICR